MFISILGATCSGKSYLKKQLIDIYKLKPLKEFTTRPIRYEEDPDSYHFISEKEFEELREKKEIAFCTTFDTVHGIWTYGVLVDDLLTAMLDKEFSYIIATNPENNESLDEAVNKLGKFVFSIKIDIDDKILAERIVKRKDQVETIRRVLADKADLSDIDTWHTYEGDEDDFEHLCRKLDRRGMVKRG